MQRIKDRNGREISLWMKERNGRKISLWMKERNGRKMSLWDTVVPKDVLAKSKVLFTQLRPQRKSTSSDKSEFLLNS